MKKVLAVLMCLSMLIVYIPAGTALADEVNPLPQTPVEYAASDYAKYAARMAVGDTHVALIKADGSLVLGGDNTYGQRDVPAELNGVRVKAVAAGLWHTLALSEDGRVFAWGSAVIDISETKAPVSIPEQVQAVQGSIKLIAAGACMSAVVTNNNNVIVWGQNLNNLDQVPAGLGNIVAIAVSTYNVVTLDDAGNVSVWGSSYCNTVPDGLNGNVVAIASGQWHWLALKKDGTVSITGNNLTTSQNITTQTGVRAIAGGWQSSLALLADGSVKIWGRTPPSGTNKNGKELIPASAGIKAIAEPVDSYSNPAVCAMQGDGGLMIVAPAALTTALSTFPLPEGFNFLATSGHNAGLSSLTVAGSVYYDLAL